MQPAQVILAVKVSTREDLAPALTPPVIHLLISKLIVKHKIASSIPTANAQLTISVSKGPMHVNVEAQSVEVFAVSKNPPIFDKKLGFATTKRKLKMKRP